MLLGIWWDWQNLRARRFAKPLYAYGTEPCLRPVSAHSGDDRTRGLLRSQNAMISAPKWRHQPFTGRPEISIVPAGNDNAELVMASR